MSFRKFGGLDHSARNNIIRNHYSNSDNPTISNYLGQPNSKIVSESNIDMNGNFLLNVGGVYFLNGGYTGDSGDGTGTSVKSFVIDHPINPSKYLVHGCLEGPESGVYYRGTSEITNNDSITIKLPDYVEKLARDFTVQITPIFDGNRNKGQYFTSKVMNNCFTVYGPNGEFNWFVNGKRANIQVEPDKSSVIVKGDGPYKWM